MQKEIILKGGKIVYTLKISKRSRSVRLAVSRDSFVTVTIPWRMSEGLASDFILQKSDWLFEKLTLFKNSQKSSIPRSNRKDYLKYKELAREIAQRKLAYFNRFYNFSFARISIRSQKTRWGSCSGNGNLNFNYRIIYLSEKLCDYIIVHELCHLGQFNHSKNFWALVEKTVPDYRKIRKEVKNI